ncbi:ThaI family type II restriction endonuclease [bacterium]|nr:ThaI family type II restriction endonuclease [bacterium]RQV97431.1 MAG: type II restriction endonuclease subunit R [bacterium]
MIQQILDLFNDKKTVEKIQNKLPKLFYLAELESQRAGKVGMEVGSLRERILVSLLLYKFGEKNVETEIRITEPEIDVLLFYEPISIKTKTGTGFSGVKLIWTVDEKNAKEFKENYIPHCDIMYAQINWDNIGGLFYIPVETQKNVFEKIGRYEYIKLPPLGTNPRGVEITSKALQTLTSHNETLKIEIAWKKERIEYNPFKRWVELWKQD